MKKIISLVAILLSFTLAWAGFSVAGAEDSPSHGEHLVTIYDGGVAQNVISRGSTVGEVLKEAKIDVEKVDRVEPALETELNDQRYHVNIYRARPVLIVDGTTRQRIMTSQQSPQTIMAEAQNTLYPEDAVEVQQVQDILRDGGAGERLIIDRAQVINVDLYGRPVEMRTQAATFGEFLKEKGIVLGPQDGASQQPAEALAASVKIWRDGKQTLTIEQDIAFATDRVQDRNREVGFREVQSPGVNGKRTVTYEIDVRNGQEIARREIQSVTLKEPVKQVEIIGAKPVFTGDFAAALAQLRACESGGRYDRNSGNGYYGAYQYDIGTWGGYGGYANASLAPPAVQDQKVWETYQRRGWQPWPHCGAARLPDTYR